MNSETLPSLHGRLFTPLWISQSLSALNDNIFRQGVIAILIASNLPRGPVFASLTTALFVLPFFLFSATAGSIADRFPKARVMRWLRFAEIFVFAAASYSLIQQNIFLMALCIFIGGTMATFYGPLKISVLPELLPARQLVGANGLIEAGLFLSILCGTMIGSLAEDGLIAIVVLLMISTFVAWGLSFLVPERPAAAPHLQIDINIVRTTKNVLISALSDKILARVLLGIAWFWFVGSAFLAQFAGFVKNELHGMPSISALFLGLFSVGIALGSVACHKLLRGEISAKFVPLAALFMSVFMIDLYFAAQSYTALMLTAPQTLLQFLSYAQAWRIVADLVLIALFAGLYVVPLTTMMQAYAADDSRARIVAASNILDALLMVAASLICAALLTLHFKPSVIFLTLGFLNACVAIYICRLLPTEMVKGFFAAILRLFYKIEVRGLENLKAAGPCAVLVVNHLSYIDGILLAAFLPGKLLFAVNATTGKKWWARPFLALVETYFMQPTEPMAAKGFIRAIQSGQHGVIFPEGRLTQTGNLMKIYEGPGLIADKAGAPIVPIRIDGLQYTPFSKLGGKMKLRWFPTLTISVLPPMQLSAPDHLTSRARREAIGTILHGVMTDMIFQTHTLDQTIFSALLDAREKYGRKTMILEDIARKPMSYDGLLLGSLALGKKLSALTKTQENVGLLLPNSIAASVTFWGLQAEARVPAMLNFSSGVQNILSACQAANIKTIITSKQFVDKANLHDLIAALTQHHSVLYLEDVRGQISVLQKVTAWLRVKLNMLPRTAADVEQPAVILFTSGSEGTPKGVALSHRNIMANFYQVRSVIDFTPRDILLNALPVFHSFGLCVGTILPVLAGVCSFQYPSPLHYRIVAELAYDTGATIFFGTDTFLAGYGKVANPYDFHTMRYVFAGAEKLKDETRRLWEDKFGIRIFEGYGVTETAPVLAINTAMHNRSGTVGRLLPGIQYRLEPVPGIAEGGRLFVRGPNVMMGYLKAEMPGALLPTDDSWHDTGDIVTIDEDGFIKITGRVKRFAKIAGEMISLGAVEDIIAKAWPDFQHAVIVIPDDRKGEALVLFTTKPDMVQEDITHAIRSAGANELMIPKQILHRAELPLLGTGKTDYVGLKEWALGNK